MTNEQLYILLRIYHDKLLEIEDKCRDYACSKDGQAFIGEINRLATEIERDMDTLRLAGELALLAREWRFFPTLLKDMWRKK